MNKYKVIVIDTNVIRTPEEYEAAMNGDGTICNGLNSVWDFCGGKLPRQRCGYAGCRGNIEYVAFRIK